jgi:hypothetical protein
MKTIRISHERFGETSTFTSLEEATATIRQFAPDVELTEHGSQIRDERGEVVGEVVEEKPYYGELHDYTTGQHIRPATEDEQQDSREAAESDGGAGVIDVDGRRCYVED